MKKNLIVLLLIFFICGCANTSIEKKEYLSYIEELKTINSSSKDYPFSIEVKYDKITKKEIRYQVIIDEVKEDITDITIIAYHNKDTKDIYPSMGIFDEKESLLKDKKPSGLILVGYIPYKGDIDDFKITMKVLVKYKINNKEYKIHYVTKK
jgi:hypothetical protein